MTSACGGDDESSSTSPMSTSSPTPSPTPTSTPTSSNFLLDPTPITDVEFTSQWANEVTFYGDLQTGIVEPNSSLSFSPGRSNFRYNHDEKTFLWIALSNTGYREYGTYYTSKITEWLPEFTDTKFWGYRNVGKGFENSFRLYKSGDSNSELKLKHSGFGHLRSLSDLRGTPAEGLQNGRDRWLAYGVHSPTSDFPTAGIETYNGVIYGFAIDPVAGKQYDLKGSASITVDFAAFRYSTSVEFSATSNLGQQVQVGSGTSTNGVFDTQTRLSRIAFRPEGANFSELDFSATFHGPSAQEIVGTFDGEIAVNPAGDPIFAQGIIAVKRR